MGVDIITIDGEDYDPYFILGVASDDTDEHINQIFRKKVKKYHPDKVKDKNDKKKYEYYFKIIVECYGYIKNKRSSCDLKKNRRSRSQKQSQKQTCLSKNELEEFNKSFEKKYKSDSDKKDNKKRLQKIEDYVEQDNIEQDNTIAKQFSKTKFSNKDFNAVFEYNKNLQKDDIASKTLIYKTNDGFFGYNTSDVGDCAMVSSFNGLLISGDTVGEMGRGYWGNSYSDYNQCYGNAVKNPKGKLNIEKICKENKKNIIDEPKVKTTFNEYKRDYNTFKYTVQNNYNKEQEKLFKRTFDHLLEKEKWDEQVVMKFKNQYDSSVIEQALNGELERTPTFMQNLKGHYKMLNNG